MAQSQADVGLAQIIERAIDLTEQKDAIYVQLAQARTAARALVGVGLGSEDQRRWVEEYMPVKQKGVTRPLKPNKKEQAAQDAAKLAEVA